MKSKSISIFLGFGTTNQKLYNESKQIYKTIPIIIYLKIIKNI